MELKVEDLDCKHIDIIEPINKAKWKLYVETAEDGSLNQIHTGWYGGSNNTPYWPGWNNKEKPDYKATQPFVFEGGLIPASHYRGRSAAGMSFLVEGFKECYVEMHISGATELLKQIAAGQREAINGAIRGRWSFHKGGANVFVRPHAN